MRLWPKASWRGLTMLGVSLSVVLFVGSGIAAYGLKPMRLSRPNPFKSFPLWKDAPGKTYAILGEGELPNRTRWGVYASKAAVGARGRKLPCITVAKITQSGRYGNASECGKPTPADDQHPVFLTIGGSGPTHVGGPIVGQSVSGASLVPEVTSVEMSLSSGEKIIRHAKLFNSRQQAKTGLDRFRYVAFATMRDICVVSFTGFGASGEVLFELPTELGC